jgi:DDB1- and CUL4-associated factor 17
VTYEDELDVLVVTQVQQCLDDDGYTAHVQLHDNQTGKLLKTINLIEKWDTVSI